MKGGALSSYLRLSGLCPNPIFIIGSPRSGTTALAQALGCHPELWVSEESYFLHQLYGNDRASHVWEHNHRRATPSWLRKEGVDRGEFLGFVGLGMNALFSSRSGGRRWIDQTPLYTLMVADLAHMFPGAYFVHIVRDGRAVVRSMSQFEAMFDDRQREQLTDEVPAWAHDFREACRAWSESVDTALDFEADHPERCLTVRNEVLATSPDAGFKDIHTFLGLDHHEGPARKFGGNRVNSSFRRNPQTRPADGTWPDWTREHRCVFVDVAGASLLRAGYSAPEALEAWTAEVDA